MRVRASVLALNFTVCAAIVVGAPPERRPPTTKLTFYHWWTSPSEAAALAALTERFTEKYPDVSVAPQSSPGTNNVRSLFFILKSQLARNEALPDAFQMHAGCAGQVFYDADLLSPLDDVWEAEKLEAQVAPVIRDLNRFGDHYYSVPLNIHRTNLVWYNKALLEKHGIKVEKLTTWEAFFEAAKTLRAAGVASPIQMGPTWTAQTVFEGIMASLGIEVYEDAINGKLTDAKDPQLEKAFTIFKQYLSYVNKDHGEIAWDLPIKRLTTSEGAFWIMGDWADGEFRAAHLKYNQDYGAFAVPGTAGMFGLGIDTFQRPKGLANATNSDRWLRLAASREGQDAFNPLKGSISPRADTDVSRYGAYQRTAIADLKAARFLYPTLGDAAPEAFNAHLAQDLTVFMSDQDVHQAASSVASAASQLTGKYGRVWRLRR